MARGEYLPDLKRREVELARVVMASASTDVISLRARWGGGRYHYRIVDGCEADCHLCRKTSRRTLTPAQVIEIFDTADSGEVHLAGGLVETWWNDQFVHGKPPEDCTDFAWVESELYLDVPVFYEARAEVWAARRREESAN